MIAAYTKTRELYTIDNTNRRLRVRSSWVTKRRTYLTFPEFSIANTWLGASQIIREFHFSLPSAVSILNLFAEAPEDANFCACVAWKPTATTIVRYKLWSGVGEILWAPDYAGEAIGADFSIEIWNTNNPTISGGGYVLYLSSLIIPTDFCDPSDIEIGTDFSICTDITFDPTNFNPILGDYYVLNGTCGLTTLIEPNAIQLSPGYYIKASDDTWHTIEIVNAGDYIYTNLLPAATPPVGTLEYLPLIDLNSGAGFEIRALAMPGMGPEGATIYGMYIGNLLDSISAAYGILYHIATDGEYYGITLRAAWDDYAFTTVNEEASFIQVDQEPLVQ